MQAHLHNVGGGLRSMSGRVALWPVLQTRGCLMAEWPSAPLLVQAGLGWEVTHHHHSTTACTPHATVCASLDSPHPPLAPDLSFSPAETGPPGHLSFLAQCLCFVPGAQCSVLHAWAMRIRGG